MRTAPPNSSSAPAPAPFSTHLPPELIERLRVAAPQLQLRDGPIAALTIGPPGSPPPGIICASAASADRGSGAIQLPER
jgi:hypothetical protein